MAFGASHVFSSFLSDVMSSKAYNLTADVNIKIALFSNTTDSATAALDTLAHNTYLGSGGQFVSGNEISGTGWSTGGVNLGTLALAAASGGTALVHYAAANVSASGVTIASAFYGGLVYDSGNSSKGIAMIAFGGSYTVGGGVLSVNWGNDSNASPCIFYITV
jgi:hypothetical protein